MDFSSFCFSFVTDYSHAQISSVKLMKLIGILVSDVLTENISFGLGYLENAGFLSHAVASLSEYSIPL